MTCVAGGDCMGAELTYRPHGTSHFSVELTTVKGSRLMLRGDTKQVDPAVSGSKALTDNQALRSSAWAFGEMEYQYRRSRSDAIRKHLAKSSSRFRHRALSIALVADNLGTREIVGWCSGCMSLTDHHQANLGVTKLAVYACKACGTPTTPCAIPNCRNLALRGRLEIPAPRYCAEHRHDIPSFARARMRLDSVDGYRQLLNFEKHNAAKATKLTVGMVGAAVVVGPLAFAAAPLIGGALGASAIGGGLTGAAATSHGLALLGGGAIAGGGLGLGGGMAAGVVVVSAAGASLGGALGMSVVNAYVRDDRSFAIERIRNGPGVPVLFSSGFLKEQEDGWGHWQTIIDGRYPDSPVYRVRWGATDLNALRAWVSEGGARYAMRKAAVQLGKHASRKAAKGLGAFGFLNVPLVAAGLLKNPWYVAKARADMTGAVLADIISRCPDRFVLVGHSLGGAVMLSAAQALGTRRGKPKIESVHLLGAAVSTGGDWNSASRAVSGDIWNYYSSRDQVLAKAFTTAQLGKKAIGGQGMKSSYPNVHDRNVTRRVQTHSDYVRGVQLQ